MNDILYTHPEPRDFAVGNGSQNVVIEYPHAKGISHKVHQIHCGYAVDPAADSVLTVEVTTPKDVYVVVRKYPITKAGPAPLFAGIETKKGQGLRITLSAGANGAAYLNIVGYEVSSSNVGP